MSKDIKIALITTICNFCNKEFRHKKTNNARMFCDSCRTKNWKIYGPSDWNSSPAGKEYMKRYIKDYVEKLKNIVYSHYGWKCNCCGEMLVSMLTIDHVENDGYKDRKNNISGITLYKRIIEEEFPNKYQIFCMNCNWSKRILKGICQHKI